MFSRRHHSPFSFCKTVSMRFPFRVPSLLTGSAGASRGAAGPGSPDRQNGRNARSAGPSGTTTRETSEHRRHPGQRGSPTATLIRRFFAGGSTPSSPTSPRSETRETGAPHEIVSAPRAGTIGQLRTALSLPSLRHGRKTRRRRETPPEPVPPHIDKRGIPAGARGEAGVLTAHQRAAPTEDIGPEGNIASFAFTNPISDDPEDLARFLEQLLGPEAQPENAQQAEHERPRADSFALPSKGCPDYVLAATERLKELVQTASGQPDDDGIHSSG